LDYYRIKKIAMSDILKLAQRWQRTFPFVDISRNDFNEQIISYDGQMGGQPYWNCIYCHNPIVDEDKKPINDPKFIAGFDRQLTIPEEKDSGHEFSEEDFNNIVKGSQDYLEKANFIIHQYLNALHTPTSLPYTHPKVNEPMPDVGYPKEFIGQHSYEDTPSHLIYNLARSLKELANSFDAIIMSSLYELQTRLHDIGVTKSDVDKLYDLFSKLKVDVEGLFKGIFPNISFYGHEAPIYNETSKQQYEIFKASLLKHLGDKPVIINKILNWVKPFVKLKGVTRGESLSLLRPYCDDCYNENAYFCEEDDCDNSSLDEDEFVEVKTRKWKKRKALPLEGQAGAQQAWIAPIEISYYCKEVPHGADCPHCGKGLKVDDDNTIHRQQDGEHYHYDCYSEIFRLCDECHEEFYAEDLMWNADQELCPNCYEGTEREDGISSTVEASDLAEAEEFFSDKEAYYPLDDSTIEKSIVPIIKAAIKHRDKNKTQYRDSILNFIQPRLPKTEEKAAVLTEAEYHENLESLLAFFMRNISELRNVKKRHPNLKGFKLFPVEFKITGGATYHEGNTFTIYPAEQFFEWAEIVMPGAREAYKTYLAKRGHHRGALGYARFSLSDDNIIVDNLQTDLDKQAFTNDILKNNPALAWWLAQIKKMWAPTLLDALNEFGRIVNKRVYLTSFEMQKNKWPKLPDRNRDVYERIPEMMDMHEENVEAKPEDLKRKTWTMRRVAEFLHIAAGSFVKLAEQTE
jgi:hypothetical protein